MSDLVVRPVRFTDDVDGMRRFLMALGLRPRMESEGGGWVDMVAGGGMVALHSARDAVRGAPPGLTALSFEVDDADALAARLLAAGVPDVSVYDEAYGRALTCRDPLGEQLVADERTDDLYGYRAHAPAGVLPSLRVMAVRFTDPLGAYGGFLEALGFERRGEPNEYFTSYTLANGDRGVVGLHHAGESRTPFADEPGAVDLSFETSEDLESVADRLRAADFEARLRRESFGTVLTTQDPDGQRIEVHQAPQDVA